MKEHNETHLTTRPPIVVVMGHVDHGKSTLLDFIRKTNVVANEYGGITQHMGAYEVEQKSEGKLRRITFIDTPGHEAFSGMRSRGASVADIAVLVVAANDGVKAQTLEALEAIRKAAIPFVVAINKIDLDGANPERVKQELAENEVYVEGYGGDVPFSLISAKKGDGIPQLLDLILLVADLGEFKGDSDLPGSGVVVESHLDPKSGAAATVIVKNGTMRKPCFLLAHGEIASVRCMMDNAGTDCKEATFSSPLLVTGWSAPPPVGSLFTTYASKRDAEGAREESGKRTTRVIMAENDDRIILPLIVKADVVGTLEAITNKLAGMSHEKLRLKLVGSGVGTVSENDIRFAGSGEKAVVLAFHVKVDRAARDLADALAVEIHNFDVIYKLFEFVEERFTNTIPKETVEEVHGKARILRIFSATKAKQVVGGSVLEGKVTSGAKLRIVRNDHEIARGEIVQLQLQKIPVESVEAGNQFGAMVESKTPIAERDIIECIVSVVR